ncbi:transmembrane protein 199 isoform X2 [Octopus sinensis]|uniref:Transmembrane protein 199 isoform X2 n=1 Tax=Octopus sinensis TaxID=2607531 RepID=A0A7E6FV56_9MOLL|nr:transmembrane protein 199 isoform X2 [Octopus sinensis]
MYVPELRLSQQLKSYLEESLHSDHLETSVKHELDKLLQESGSGEDEGGDVAAVPVKLVKTSLEALNKERTEPLYIHEMITDSELHLQKYEPPQRSAELEVRVQRLRREAENREYKQMTQNVHRTVKKNRGWKRWQGTESYEPSNNRCCEFCPHCWWCFCLWLQSCRSQYGGARHGHPNVSRDPLRYCRVFR